MGHLGIVIERLPKGTPVRVRQIGQTPRSAHIIEDRGEEVTVRLKKSGTVRIVSRTRLIFDRVTPGFTKLEKPPRFTEMGGDGQSFPKDPPQRDSVYLAFIRLRACCICAASPPSDPHHFGSGGGTALKCDDYRTVPICRKHHDEFHQTGHCAPYNRTETERELYRAQVDALIAWGRRVQA